MSFNPGTMGKGILTIEPFASCASQGTISGLDSMKTGRPSSCTSVAFASSCIKDGPSSGPRRTSVSPAGIAATTAFLDCGSPVARYSLTRPSGSVTVRWMDMYRAKSALLMRYVVLALTRRYSVEWLRKSPAA